MSVLIVSPFFHPEPISTGRYNTALAQELVRRGESVEVIASHPLYPDWHPKRSDVQLPGIRIRRGGAWLRYPSAAILRRLVLEVWFAARVWLSLLRPRRRPMRMVVIFPPCGFMALLPSLFLRGAITIGIVHDLQGVLAGSGAGSAGRLLRNIVGWIEKRAFAACDRLVFLSHTMAERAITEYSLNRGRCTVYYPFLTLPERGDRRNADLENLLPSGTVHIVYSGALGKKQEPGSLVSFMGELVRRHPGLRCHVFSGGPEFERLRANTAPEFGVSFHPLVPENSVDELYARSTVQLLPQAPGTGDGCLPSKLPNLLAAGVPIFAVCDAGSEIARLLDQAGEGAAAHADGFNAPDLLARFDALLRSAGAEPRKSRIARQHQFIATQFGVDGLINEILRS